MFKPSWKTDVLLYFSFLTLIVPVTISWLRFGCMPAYDFAIFSETLTRAWTFDWDPFLTTREIFWSQDHWDPVTLILGYMTAPLRSFVSPSIFLIWFEPTLLFFTAIYLRQALLNRGFDSQRSWAAFLFILFSPMSWNALLFPVHPTVWALCPHVLLIVWIYDFARAPRPWEILRYIFISIFIASCGEAFALSLLFFHLCLVMVTPRKRIILAILAVPIAIWAYWGMYGRIELHGSIYDHGGRLTWSLGPLLDKYAPSTDFVRRLFVALVSSIIPLLFCIDEIRRSASRSIRQSAHVLFPFMLSTMLAAPLLLGRFLGDSWRFHYGVAVIGALAPAFFISGSRILSRRCFWTLALLCVLTSIGDWGRVFEIGGRSAPACGALSRAARAEDWQARSDDIRRVQELLPEGSRVVAGGYLVPTLQWYRPDLELHVLGSFKYEGKHKLDFLWISKDPFADSWPLADEQIADLLARLQGRRWEMKTSILIQGPFDSEFLNQYQGSQKRIER